MARPKVLIVAAVGALVVLGSVGPAPAQDARREEVTPEPPKAPILTRPPELLEGAQAIYPPEEQAAGREAHVPVRIALDATGQVTDVTVLTSAGPAFDAAATEAARRHRFRAAEFDGKPGPIVIETTIHFVLEVVEVAPPTSAPTGPAAAVPSGVVTGVVKERGSRRRLAGVAIGVEGAAIEAVSGPDGVFTLTGVPAGKPRLIAVATGFDRYRAPLELAVDETAEITIYLRPRGGNPYETVIDTEREPVEVTKRTITRRQMTSVPGTFGDPLRVIQNLPGLARSPYATGILIIRGSNPDDSGLYIDGHRVPLLFHFLGGPSILNAEFLDTIDLYPGGFPARFGRIHGGVISVGTRSTKTDGVHGAADVDLIDAGVYLRAPLGERVTLAISGRRSYIDQLLPSILPEPSAGETLVVVPVYYDWQGRLDVDLPGRDELSVLVLGSDDRLKVLQREADSMRTVDLESHIGFQRLIATYRTPLDGGLVLSISPAIGRDVVSFSGGTQTSVALENEVAGLRERIVGKLSKTLRLDTGIDLEWRRTSYDLLAAFADDIRPIGGGEIDIPPEQFQLIADAYQLGAYGELAWDVTSKLRLIPGLRADYMVLGGEPRATIDPRIVARYALAKPTTLKGYVGLFTQPPQPEAFDPRVGNPGLSLERAVHVGVGVEHKLDKVFSIDTELYALRRWDQAIFSREINRRDDGTYDPEYWSSEGSSDSIGLETILRHEITDHFYGWVSYTLSRSTTKRGTERERALTAFDQTHNLTTVGSYRFDNGVEAGLRFRLVSGRPETPFVGATYEADEDDYDPVSGGFRTARRPTFHQLDVRVEKGWLFDTWLIAAYLDVMNVYNAENPEATQWDYRFRDSAPLRGMPIVPTLGVRGQW